MDQKVLFLQHITFLKKNSMKIEAMHIALNALKYHNFKNHQIYENN